MYGTVARMRVKPDKIDEFKQLGDAMRQDIPAGFVATYTYQMKDDPSEFYLVVMFESEGSYYLNADDPRTHENFVRMMEMLEVEPEWHDGHIIDQVVA